MEKAAEPKRFISVLTHDLKTPINNIIGFSNLIEEIAQNYQDETLLRYISIIRKEAELANNYIESFAHWCKSSQEELLCNEQIEIISILENTKKEYEVI